MKILALGDVVGECALRFLESALPAQRRALGADLVIVKFDNGQQKKLMATYAKLKKI